MKIRKVSAGVCALIVSVVVAACDSNPSSPSAGNTFSAGGGGSRFSTIADPGLPQTVESLKATAPGLTSPVDGGIVNDPAAVLTVTSPQSVHNVPWVFNVRFEVYALANPNSGVHSSAIVQGDGVTSHTMPGTILEDETVYVWRARAESEGEGGPWSEVYSFTTQFVKIDPPTPSSPIGGVVTASLRPQLFLTNGAVIGDAGTVLVETQVALDHEFFNIVEIGRTRLRSRGETGVPLRADLQPSTQYFWRGRQTNENLPITAALEPGEIAASFSDGSSPTASVIETSSDWSATETFQTPSAANAGPPPSGGGGGGIGFGGTGSSPNAPFTTSGGNPSNMISVVQAIAASHPGALANSCQEHGGTWEFMDRVVEALRAQDGRWGYNCKRGNCADISLDVITYYRGSAQNTQAANGSTSVQIIDIILSHCGDPVAAWIDQTQATKDSGTVGKFIYPR